MRGDDAHAFIVVSLFGGSGTFFLQVLLVYDFVVFVLRVLIEEVGLLVGRLGGHVVGNIDGVVVDFLFGLFEAVGLGVDSGIFVAGVAGLDQFVVFDLPALGVGIDTGLVFVLLGVRTILCTAANRYKYHQNQYDIIYVFLHNDTAKIRKNFECDNS